MGLRSQQLRQPWDAVIGWKISREKWQQHASDDRTVIQPRFLCCTLTGKFCRCQHPNGKHHQLYEFLKNNQILVRYMEFPEWGQGLRISVGTDQQIDACLMLIERYLA